MKFKLGKTTKKVLVIVTIALVVLGAPTAAVLIHVDRLKTKAELAQIDQDLYALQAFVKAERLWLYKEAGVIAEVRAQLVYLSKIKANKDPNYIKKHMDKLEYPFHLRMLLWCDARAWFPLQLYNKPQLLGLPSVKSMLKNYEFDYKRFRIVDDACFSFQLRPELRIFHNKKIRKHILNGVSFSARYLNIMGKALTYGKTEGS